MHIIDQPVLSQIMAPGGVNLQVYTWKVADMLPLKAGIIIVHGVGEHSRRYDHVAGWFLELGIEVRLYDQRGFGTSGGARGDIPGKMSLVEDLQLVFNSYKQELEQRGISIPPLVLGHSMGGAVVASAVTAGYISPAAMILSSPGLIPKMAAWQKLAVKVSLFINPHLKVPHGLALDKVSHVDAVVEQLKSDPLNHDKVSPALVNFMVEEGLKSIHAANRVNIPCLLLVAGDDYLVNPDGARRFYQNLKPGIGMMQVFAGKYHEIFNEDDATRQEAKQFIQEWIKHVL